ncbi:2-succinyl-5-enolpyruvyl-6-hydroxy-3-cyclohexene-1-carboxylic-acid synthase [Compostimonas suwonensis]|uniref:2-succinyl-5-enolpyruvyl-6-hydroxy-3-cyclohexene-1-carboxylate synthase n=1 Tax=Compostimonas suwonensis TaxID=1048394 RepID=A0A2M9C384_9MICO|nr:2-succinyl-5-enolpyruvyl-6-hydroxy-3-cyclohexene-1-carboxylic-acid synthase [Compostimonas suwonensis]PJJ65013.1 2-succinyl-5-enolpyruvyl-6-hydroxy-3-cyclohexene-1-carboxylate synthase [Compostimonas suwonensis]
MPEPQTSPATEFAARLLLAFVGRGVRHVVLSPGSRSQALALACAELEAVGAISLHVRIDERSAAFLALGLAVESGMPALMITTSGTAVANLHPAVLEASHSRVPLILLTADRPAELRGIRSNQTTVQPGIFGPAVRLSVDVEAPGGGTEHAGETGADDTRADRLVDRAMDAACGTLSADPGPVQLNLAFREPLSAARSSVALDAPAEVAPRPQLPPHETFPVRRGPRTVVIAGHAAGPQAQEFALAGGWPLLAEVSSGSRFGPNTVVAYRELLADADFGGRVQRAIVFGHPTLSREVPALVQTPGVETIVVSPTGEEWYNPGHRVHTVARSVLAVDEEGQPLADDPHSLSAEQRAWLGSWVTASRRVVDAGESLDAPDVAASRSAKISDRRDFAREELAIMRQPITRRMLVEAVWRVTWPHDRLVLGASRLVRELDRVAAGKRVVVHANRGLAGIDGTVATALGIALASQEVVNGAAPASTGATRVLLGDLALLHDVGSLLLPSAETRPRIQLIVGNDGGGTIFDTLEVAASAAADRFDRVLYTPQSVDVAALATAYGWSHTRATTRTELDQALTTPLTGPSILEIPLPR